MTRINSAMPPAKLTDQHLLAELRELPRIFTLVKKRIDQRKKFNDIPEEFTLNTGHVKFFYNKLDFLHNRHMMLRAEYSKRFLKNYPIKVSEYIKGYEEKITRLYLYQEYRSTEKERLLLEERISKRILESKQIPKYYGEDISKDKAIEILTK